MSEPIVVRVPGVPAPQGSKTAFVSWPKGAAKCPACGGRRGRPRAIVTEGKRGSPQRQKLDAWLEAIAAAVAFDAPAAPIEGPVRVRIAFWLPKPKSHPTWRWLAWQKPDVDKLCRSTLDGLGAAGIFTDDAQVVELAARKAYAIDRPPGALIRIEPLAEIEAQRGHAWALAGGPPPRL